MKTLLLLFFAFNAYAQDLSIKNSFQVDLDGQVFRGREPKTLVSELKELGISDVIIFKNDVKGEVLSEIEALNELQIKSHHIPFKWKDLESMELACEQVIDALQIIKRVKRRGDKVYFHCTAGEDRTGLLAGLYRISEENLSVQEAWDEELCARGYGDGNRRKPKIVTNAIHQELSPLFFALAEKIKSGHLTKKSCKSLNIVPAQYRCH